MTESGVVTSLLTETLSVSSVSPEGTSSHTESLKLDDVRMSPIAESYTVWSKSVQSNPESPTVTATRGVRVGVGVGMMVGKDVGAETGTLVGADMGTGVGMGVGPVVGAGVVTAHEPAAVQFAYGVVY